MQINVSVYHNGEIFLVVPEIKTSKGVWISQIVENMVLKEISDVILGEKIIATFDYPSNKFIPDKTDFWKEVGFKSFSSFSKKFKMIDISKNIDGYNISVWKNENKGYFPSDKLSDNIQIPLTVKKEKLGHIVRILLTKEHNIIDAKHSIITVYNTLVDYQIPFEVENLEDGHTDAYQIYIHDTYNKNYIGFMIDSGYDSFSLKDIRNKWDQYYGDLNTFEYQKTTNAEYYTKIIAITNELEIQSYLFKDGEGTLELIFEIDLLTTPKEEQDKIRSEFTSLVKSVQLK